MSFTLILPFYRNSQMLARQAEEWKGYPKEVQVVVVDDGSPEPALDKLHGTRAEVYRITVDIPWNRNGARNLGAYVAITGWILQTDIDHILPVTSARWLVENLTKLKKDHWYKFSRFRVGQADDTRKKDTIDPRVNFGEIKPHIDSYLVTRDLYWRAGGYDEDFSGSIGGSSLFLKHLAKEGKEDFLTECPLFVFTKHIVPDASDRYLSRDMTRYRSIKASKGSEKPQNPLRFPWERVK